MALFGRGLEGDESRHVPDEWGDHRHAEEVARLDRTMRHRGVTYEQMRCDPIVRADVLHYLKVCDGIDADWAAIHRRQWADAYADAHPPSYDEVVVNRANGNPHAAVVEVAATPIRTTDGFEVKYVASVPVKLHDTTVDRAAFADRFGASATVAGSGDRIAQDLREKVDRALADMAYVSAEDATAAAPGLNESVEKAVKTPLFAVGLQLTDIVTVSADAPALRARDAEKAAVEAAKAADARADELLLRFEDICRQNPDVPPGKLLMALPEGDRYEALRLLLEAAKEQEHVPGTVPPLKLAAGDGIFAVDGDEVFEVAGASDYLDLGPIRSLRPADGDERTLLGGSRDGVFLLNVRHYGSEVFRSSHAGSSPRGFSGVAKSSSEDPKRAVLWAIHGDAGLQVWDLLQENHYAVMRPEALRDEFHKAVLSLAADAALSADPATSVRATAVCGIVGLFAYVALSADGSDGGPSVLMDVGYAPNGPVGLQFEPVHFDAHASIVSLHARSTSRHLATMSDGRLLAIEKRGRSDSRVDKRPGLFERSGNNRVCAACGVPWLGDVRVAMALEDGPIVVCGPDDDVWMEYHSDHAGFVAVAASAGRLAAVTSDRQRIVIWNLGQPEWPVQDLYVLDTTRSRVADVAFL